MWKVLRKMQPLSVVKLDSAKRIWQYKGFKYAMAPAAITSAIYYMNNRSTTVPIQEELPTDFETFAPQRQSRFIEMIKYVLRVLQLSFIFAPTIVCLPLYLFKMTRQYWINIFLHAIQRAGIVWIKAFQYLSHRRDIIGEEMADKFSILRDNSPLHSFTQTQQIITRVYGRKINEMFEEFDNTPIASGSVSQVYKGKLNGKTVAIKVRHPGAGNNLERDIELLFSFSKFLSFFSKFFEIPVTEDSLKKILRQQLCFLQQKRNIDNFNQIIVDRNVKFPKTYPQSTNEVLIEEYIDGRTIGFYENNDHNLNKVIANIGAKAFFSMLMKYNFIHADCHAGNILVRFKEVPQELSSVLYAFANQAKNYIIAQIIKYGFKSQFLKKLSEENYEYEKTVQQLIDIYNERVEIIMIDVGMAIRLTKEKKQSFQQFLSEIIQGNPLQCAKWIFRISKFNGIPLKEGQNQLYLNALQSMFARVHQTTLQSLQGIVVLKQMLGVIRDHNMKIDGQISILLTNMLILQAIAKDLDPNINILRCAVPYLQYK